MKSVDYWKHDLPVINNIPADSARLVEAERIGLNLAPDTAKRIAAMPAEECLAMRKTCGASLTAASTCRRPARIRRGAAGDRLIDRKQEEFSYDGK